MTFLWSSWEPEGSDAMDTGRIRSAAGALTPLLLDAPSSSKTISWDFLRASSQRDTNNNLASLEMSA
ncbi:hypothetical protein DV515_00001286 [Chloebia gouldiae]|uniref:Uncharacterized protein n=1 Tax=Chloebia gouldiae TaxID=44316 RepID=A0A3L8SYB4_CHLGU|nr:hypothetical protein DV515_00001286 [Chloebia gouldiae]